MNRFFGKVEREIDGKKLTLVLDFNAAIHFEDATGQNFFKAVEAMDEGSVDVKVLRSIVFASMQAHHPEADIQQAGRIMSQDTSIIAGLISSATKGVESAGDTDGKKIKAA